MLKIFRVFERFYRIVVKEIIEMIDCMVLKSSVLVVLLEGVFGVLFVLVVKILMFC